MKSGAKGKPARILVGTASWSDPGFVEHWYPKGMPAADRLSWYAEQFQMVEINSTFYAVPAPQWWNNGAEARRILTKGRGGNECALVVMILPFLPQITTERAQFDT